MARSSKRTTKTSSSAPDAVTQWALDVVAGKIVQGPHVRNSCRRHLKDLREGPKRGLKWDIAAAERAFRFFEQHLTLSDGQFDGKPFVLAPVQKFIVGSIFGWKDRTGFRRFRRAYIEMGKGNGKTPMVSGIGLYGMLVDGEPGAQVFMAGADKSQSENMFADAVGMVQRSHKLRQQITPTGKLKVTNLGHLRSGSFMRPVSSQMAKTGSGPRPHYVLADELHEHSNRKLVETLERGFKWRRQPLLVMITNSGSSRNSFCWEEHQYAVEVAAGTQTPDDEYTFVGEHWGNSDREFSFVCALDKGDDPFEDPSCWPKANPLLGVILQNDSLAGNVAEAKGIPGRRNGILRLHFCVWTDSDVAWMSREVLEAALADFDPEVDHAGKDVVITLDLSATQDFTVIGYGLKTGEIEVEREMPDGSTSTVMAPTFDLWAEAFTPKDTLAARALQDKAPYELWAQEGHIFPIRGKVIDLAVIAARLAAVSSIYAIKALVYDRYSFTKLKERMRDIGLSLREIEHPQGGKRRAKAPDEVIEAAKLRDEPEPEGLWFPGSLNEFELMLLEGRCRIRRNPATISAMMSVVVHPDPFNNRWMEKDDAVNRIDIAVALCMLAGSLTTSWLTNPVEKPLPFYLQAGFDINRSLGLSDESRAPEDVQAEAARQAAIQAQVNRMLGID